MLQKVLSTCLSPLLFFLQLRELELLIQLVEGRFEDFVTEQIADKGRSDAAAAALSSKVSGIATCLMTKPAGPTSAHIGKTCQRVGSVRCSKRTLAGDLKAGPVRPSQEGESWAKSGHWLSPTDQR